MIWLSDVFGQKGDITALQECARAVLVFAFGLVIVRLAGRRVFGRWAALDIIVSVMVGSCLSRAITGNAPLWGTLAASALIMALHWLLAHLTVLRIGFSRLLEGHAVELAQRGKVSREQQFWHAVSDADLDEAVRQQGVGRVEETSSVVLEPSGKITVLK